MYVVRLCNCRIGNVLIMTQSTPRKWITFSRYIMQSKRCHSSSRTLSSKAKGNIIQDYFSLLWISVCVCFGPGLNHFQKIIQKVLAFCSFLSEIFVNLYTFSFESKTDSSWLEKILSTILSAAVANSKSNYFCDCFFFHSKIFFSVERWSCLYHCDQIAKFGVFDRSETTQKIHST